MNFNAMYPQLNIKTSFRKESSFKNRLSKIDMFLKSVDYIIPPIDILPNNMVRVTYTCGHSHIIRQDHLLEGRLCTTQPCFHSRQSELMIKYNKEHPENRIKISKGTVKGMQNMSANAKKNMILHSVQGHKLRNSFKIGETQKRNLNNYSYRLKFMIRQSNRFRNKPSRLESLFENILKESNIKYFSQAWLDLYELENTWFICDFYLFDYDLYINIDGFFHQVDDLHKERDNLLDSLCNKYNINILHLTEKDLLDNNFNLEDLLVKYGKGT